MSDDNFSNSQRNQFLLFEIAGIGLPGTGGAEPAAWPSSGRWMALLAGGSLLLTGIAVRRSRTLRVRPAPAYTSGGRSTRVTDTLRVP
jgi:hypothetical protein